MDRETAKEEIRRNWRPILESMTGAAKQRVNGEKSYICPICGHGKNGDGLTRNPKSKDGNSLKCFGCNFSGDIIDLYQQNTGADFPTALSLLAQEAGITIDPPTSAREDFKDKDNKTSAPAAGNTPQADYTEYYKSCRERIEEPAAADYLKRRGISIETAKAFYIGYDPQADPASAPAAMGNEYKPHPCPRLIFPSSKSHYVGRRIDGKKEYEKMNAKDSHPDIFNKKALYTQEVQEVFVFEGVFDALSAIEVGAAAIATNSADNIKVLIEQLERKRTEATLILCPDNDSDPKTQETVKKHFNELAAGLQRLNISFIRADVNGQYKDANEYLTGNKEEFIRAIEETRKRVRKPDNTTGYIDYFMTDEIEKFKTERQTGFSNLDRETGGLYSGLYVLAAISSLGKTSFALQLADQLAEQGHDVIFFSLEQSRLEMVSKSIARRTAQKDMSTAVTSLSIRKGYLPEQVQAAAREYKEAVKDRISVIEGNFSCNSSFIGDYVRQYIRRNNTRPVVFVDYLQILQPAEETRRQTVREIVDTTTTELKRLSREQGLTIIAISSVNRSNYLQSVDFESLKESGGIEYTADCVWGLQLQCLKDDIFSKEGKLKEKREIVKKAKAENPRRLQLVCLKNRYGKSSFDCSFNYFPANDLFTEDTGADFEQDYFVDMTDD